MNAYQFEVGGETEIIAANTIFEALKFYTGLNGFTLDDFDKDDDIEEIPKDKWETVTVRNTEHSETEKDSKEEYTLAELMEGLVDPSYLSTTVQ